MAARFVLAVALVASIWPFVAGSEAHACTPFRGSYEHVIRLSVEHSEQIFIATVHTAVEDRDDRVRSFAVERYLKGEGARQLTTVQRPICPARYKEGGTYLVGWLGPPVRLDKLEPAEAQARIAEMEAALLTEYGTLGSFTDDPLPPWATTAGFGAAGLLGAALLVGVRRLRSS